MRSQIEICLGDSSAFLKIRMDLFVNIPSSQHFQMYLITQLALRDCKKLFEQKRGEEPKIFNSLGNFVLGSYVMPKNSGNTVFLNYYGPANTFPYYHLDTILDDSTFQVRTEQEFGLDLNLFEEHLKGNTFKDKIVLVGASVEELHDLFPTPFYDPGKGMGSLQESKYMRTSSRWCCTPII